jgi:hypothetical protein
VASQEDERDEGRHPRWKPAKRDNSKLFEESTLLFRPNTNRPTKTQKDFLPKIWNKPPPKAKVLIARSTPNHVNGEEQSNTGTVMAQLTFEPFETHQRKLKDWYKDR